MNRKTLFFLISVIILLSLLLKLYYARICSLYIWGDTCVIGLIAKQILKGEFPLFFYGHFYMGVLESWIIAPFFFLFGISSFTIHLGPIFVSCLFLVSVYFLGKELKDYKIGLIALLYCGFPPFYLLSQSVIPLGYHIEMLLIGNLIFILTLKIISNKSYTKGFAYFLFLGIISGLGFWNTYLILYYLIAAGLFLCINLVIKKRPVYLLYSGVISILFFFLGGLHFWIFNFAHDFASFKFQPMRSPGFLILFNRIITYHLPKIVRLENNILGIALASLYLISSVFFIFIRNHKKWLFIIFILGLVYFLTRSEYYAYCMDHRYVLPIFSVISFVLAFFLDWLNKKIRFSGSIILSFVLIVNISGILKGFSSDRKEFARDGSKYNELIHFFKMRNMNGVYGKFADVGTINFIGQNNIYAAETPNSSAPFDAEVQGELRNAYLEGDRFKSFFDMACRSYKTDMVAGYNIYYDFKKKDYCGIEIPVNGWNAESNYNNGLTAWAFDRNLDRYWSSISPMKSGMYFQVEFPKLYKVYKMHIFNMPNDDPHLPMGYRILASKDGEDWELIEDCGETKFMFWSGPNIIFSVVNTRMEVIFNPVEARFIRIEQTGESKYPWQINEILFYEYRNDKEFKIRDYVKSAKDIYNILKRIGINFVYTDYWLSARIKILSRDKIGVLGIFNECWPDRKNMSRMIELNKNRAIIIEKQNENGADKVLTEFKLPYRKRHFGEYVLYYFSPETEKDNYFLINQKSLYWIGTTISRINIRVFGKLLFNYGEDFYFRAAGYFPGNPLLRYKLMQIYKEKGLMDLYEKEKQFIKHRFSPKIKRHVKFSNGIEFLGLDIENLADKKYRINYYWRLQGNPTAKIFVFAHFIKDGNVVLQNDHPLLEQYLRLPVLLPDEIWKESYFINIPEGFDIGSCKIRIGLWIPIRGEERIKIAGSKKDYLEIDLDMLGGFTSIHV